MSSLIYQLQLPIRIEIPQIDARIVGPEYIKQHGDLVIPLYTNRVDWYPSRPLLSRFALLQRRATPVLLDICNSSCGDVYAERIDQKFLVDINRVEWLIVIYAVCERGYIPEPLPRIQSQEDLKTDRRKQRRML